MPRMTITLSKERHRALKEAAARRNTSIAQLIDESLEYYGIKTTETAAALVAAARERARQREADALELATRETADERSR